MLSLSTFVVNREIPMTPRPISKQEVECLVFVASHGPLAASAVCEGFGTPRGLARTTVLTVLERLRRKGHVGRRREGGVFVYRALDAHADVLRSSVVQFVERALGGSLAPFAAYLADRAEVSDQELRELRRAVAGLSARRKP
jgi:predicted transcriptional regulator